MAAPQGEMADLGLPLPVRVKMEAQSQAASASPEGNGKFSSVSPGGAAEELARGASVPRVKQELAEEQPQSWDCQWQRLLEVVPTPVASSVRDNPQLPPLSQGGSTEAYLATFERVADASQWPREEWVTRLVPVLSGQAQQAYFGLDAKDKGDYGKVKVAILRLDSYMATEAHRQGFRHFCYQDTEGPRGTCQQLQELCHRWLRPESQTKEQILDLLILEQFLVILPQEMQDWIRERGPETCDRAVALAEEFLQEQQETERWAQQITVPIEMVIVNSPIVDLSDSTQRHLRREAKPADEDNSLQESYFASRAVAKELHQPAVEEPGRRAPGGFGEAVFPRGDPRRPHGSERGVGMQQKGGCLSVRVIKDRGLRGVLADPEAKRHLCKECGKRFRKRWDLIRHERIHTGEKPYQCPECGNSFNRNTTLTKHLLVHSGEKPHQCAYCGKRFTRRSHVVNHQRRHSCQGRS
ncbi:zinc finger and SCAN domain-containing protein 31 [Zootoca vivipara]|uniref:zinc finger and SCAN domain-containing protein 31 n=1 Tax=Zootoca vivipara TaxID=8524 RepID=UPI0015929A24|nr:zinc finger and SCAN domain-containing protein 31 [Zootoca vivipara]XP_034990904.1 zinc finger and SCAN domain-containing protein 31 [Zootoca vivipara]XP_034990905.1 zinc finger and SCAN domain-containing protein 31-like [Zootoca vivipara]XP_034990906.1 zinc finger and SCAN domain-containing protein 31-like [Zootoca vivipara]